MCMQSMIFQRHAAHGPQAVSYMINTWLFFDIFVQIVPCLFCICLLYVYFVRGAKIRSVMRCTGLKLCDTLLLCIRYMSVFFWYSYFLYLLCMSVLHVLYMCFVYAAYDSVVSCGA